MFQNFVQRQVRATVENANRISLLRDKDGDGVAEEKTVFLEGLRQPFGMALIGDKFYVANTDSVVVYPYKEGDTRITAQGQKLMDLKVGHHWTRNLLALARRHQALCDGRIGQQHRREQASKSRKGAPQFTNSISPPASRASLPAVCATRTAWTSSHRLASCGRS